MAVQDCPRKRELPKAGEIWQHYRGQECLILGILISGKRGLCDDRIAYQKILITSNYNQNTGIVETTKTYSSDRYQRPIADFMGRVESGDRFERVEDDETIWDRIVELDAVLQ